MSTAFVTDEYVRRGRENGALNRILTPEQDAFIDDALRGLPDFPTGEIYANPVASQAMLDDGSFEVLDWLVQEAAQEFARTGTFVRGPTRVLRDPYTNSPFIHFYCTRGDRAAITKATEIERG